MHETQIRYYQNNREKILKDQRKNNRRKRARKGKTEEEIKKMDYLAEARMERRKEKESIKKNRSFYNEIIKRDVNISLLKNKTNITAKEACIAVSCEPAQKYLDYILESNPTLKFKFSKEELRKRVIQLEKKAFENNKMIVPRIAIAIVLYHSSYYTQSKIAKICGTTSVTMRTYTKKIFADLEFFRKFRINNNEEVKEIK